MESGVVLALSVLKLVDHVVRDTSVKSRISKASALKDVRIGRSVFRSWGSIENEGSCSQEDVGVG